MGRRQPARGTEAQSEGGSVVEVVTDVLVDVLPGTDEVVVVPGREVLVVVVVPRNDVLVVVVVGSTEELVVLVVPGRDVLVVVVVWEVLVEVEEVEVEVVVP